MKLLPILLFTAIIIFTLTLTLATFIVLTDNTKIGNAIYNYILSKIVKETPNRSGSNAPIKPTLAPMPEIKPMKIRPYKEIIEEIVKENKNENTWWWNLTPTYRQS